MKKGAAASVAAWCMVAMVVVLVAEVHETAAASCNPLELTPCFGAITGGQNPSSECCSKLTEQVPCLCGYIKNPAFKPYIDSPNAQKVATSCGVATPKC